MEGKRKRLVLTLLADIFLFAGSAIIVLTFCRPLYQEIKYQVNQWQGVKYEVKSEVGKSIKSIKSVKSIKLKEIEPLDTNFGIVIPKIDANAKIFANVDPFNPKEFLPVLKKGVAHAKGTGFPGEGRNIYLFAHSVDSFLNFDKYNAVFYLIGKLDKGDEIDILDRKSVV